MISSSLEASFTSCLITPPSTSIIDPIQEQIHAFPLPHDLVNIIGTWLLPSKQNAIPDELNHLFTCLPSNYRNAFVTYLFETRNITSLLHTLRAHNNEANKSPWYASVKKIGHLFQGLDIPIQNPTELFPNIKVINFLNYSITQSEFASLRDCKHIEELAYTIRDGHTYTIFLSYLVSIKRLTINCPSAHDLAKSTINKLLSTVAALPLLESFQTNLRLYQSALENLTASSTLKKLHFHLSSSTIIDPYVLQAFTNKNMLQLQQLAIYTVPDVPQSITTSDTFISHLGALTNLRSLDLTISNLPPTFFSICGQLQFLEVLKISNIKKNQGLLMTSLAKLTHLQLFHCTNSVIDGSHLQSISKIKNLKCLQFQKIVLHENHDQWTPSFANFSRLTTLSIINMINPIPYNLIQRLPMLHSLQSLELHSQFINTAKTLINSLLQMRSLTSLKIYFNPLIGYPERSQIWATSLLKLKEKIEKVEMLSLW